jgi:glycosyltransferase involved in cell wall biosynthesis
MCFKSIQIIVVDDGSSDKTVEYVRNMMKNEKSIKLLVLGQNRGKGGAIKRGVRHCSGNYILMVGYIHIMNL